MRKLLASLKRAHENEEGVTLLELIVVTALLGVLIVIAIPLYGDIEETAQQNVQLNVATNAATEIAIGILNGVPATLTIQDLNSRFDGYVYSTQAPTGVTPPNLFNTTSDNVWIVATRASAAGPGVSSEWAYAGNAIGAGDSWSGSKGAIGPGLPGFPGGGGLPGAGT